MKWRVNFFDDNGDETRSLVVEADSGNDAETAAENEADKRDWPKSFVIADAVSIDDGVTGKSPKTKARANKKVKAGPVDALTRLSVIERLLAAEGYYRQYDARLADGLILAIEIALPDGWRHIAPAWVKPDSIFEGVFDTLQDGRSG